MGTQTTRMESQSKIRLEICALVGVVVIMRASEQVNQQSRDNILSIHVMFQDNQIAFYGDFWSLSCITVRPTRVKSDYRRSTSRLAL